jgi:hypothetical protein
MSIELLWVGRSRLTDLFGPLEHSRIQAHKRGAEYHCPFFSFFLSLRQNFAHLRTAADHSSLLRVAFPWLPPAERIPSSELDATQGLLQRLARVSDHDAGGTEGVGREIVSIVNWLGLQPGESASELIAQWLKVVGRYLL